MDLIELIAHERQQGQLCAQHAINNLLQASYYTAIDLAEIAQQLDREEEAQLQMNLVDKSQNYDDSGFFSIQVIQRALQVWNLELIPYNSTNRIAVNARLEPGLAVAYLCNLDEHWFSLRRFGHSVHRWYNLNSVFEQPRHVSLVYLQLYLHSLQEEGYSIFVLHGNLSLCKADYYALDHPIPPTLNTSIPIEESVKESIEEIRKKRLSRFDK